MKNFEKNLISVLTRSGIETKQPPEITALIAAFIVSDVNYLNMKFPTQSSLNKSTPLTELVIHQSWDLLSKSYELIITKKGVGTFVVPDLSKEKVRKILTLIDLQLNRPATLVFDRLSMTVMSDSLNNRFFRAFELAHAVPEAQPHSVLHKSLLEEFTKLMRKNTGYPYKPQEIYYAREYRLLILNVCKVFLREERWLVLYKPITSVVQRIVEKINRKVTSVERDINSDAVVKLDALCSANKVGIVYFELSPFSAEKVEANQAAWQCLIRLQIKYKFILLLDDRFPGKSALPDIWMDRQIKNNKLIIYLRPGTLVDQRLGEIELMATSSHVKLRIGKSVLADHNRISKVTANAMLSLIKDGSLHKAERYSSTQIEKFMLKANEEFKDSGTVKISSLQQQNAWFLHLEPKMGVFPPDVYQQLMDLNIYVMNPAIYSSLHFDVKGIWISISDYKDASKLLQDIRKLISALKKMII